MHTFNRKIVAPPQRFNFLAMPQTVAVFFGALILSFVLYGNTIFGTFVYDDHFFSNRPELRTSEELVRVWGEPYLPQNPVLGLYRPLTVFTFVLNFVLFGESPAHFHIVNIVVHALVVFFLFVLLKRLFDARVALIAALFFAFFPIHSEAVAFMKSRDEVLSALLLIVSWIFFLRATDEHRQTQEYTGTIFLSAIFFLLGILAKETFIILPLLFLMVWRIRTNPPWFLLAKTCIPYAIVISGYLAIRFMILGSQAFGKSDTYYVLNPLGQIDFWSRVWTLLQFPFIYIAKTFIPYHLSATYHLNHVRILSDPFHSWCVIFSVAIIGAMIYVLLHSRWRNSPLGIGALMFLIPYIMMSNIFFQPADMVAERWMYVPSMGLSLIAGYAGMRIYERKKSFAISLMALILSIYGGVLISRNQIWLSERSLFESMVRDAPESIQGHLNIAKLYITENGKGDFDAARPHVMKAMQIYDQHPPVLELYAILLMREGKLAEAEHTLLRVFEIRQDLPSTYIDYAILLTKQKRYQESIGVVQKFLQNKLRQPEVRFIMAVNYYRLGNMDEAKKYFDWNPTNSEIETLEKIKSF